MGFLVRLDRGVSLVGEYLGASDGRTKFTLPFPIASDASAAVVVMTPGPSYGGLFGREYTLKATVGSPAVYAEGKFDEGLCFIGNRYSAEVEFSELFIRAQSMSAEGNIPPAVLKGRLQLLTMLLSHKDSGYFEVWVESEGRVPIRAPHLGIHGRESFTVGRPSIDSVPFSVPILARSSTVKIRVVNDRHFPDSLLSAEIIANFTTDARRI